jgi:hypothetical protein
VEHLARDREQLWAEAKARFDAECVWWLDTAGLVQMASDEQNDRYEGDPWEEVIGRWADDRPSVSRGPVPPVLGLEALPRTAWLAVWNGDIEEAMTRLFPLCSLGVLGLFPVVGVENSGHEVLFPVFPSIVMADAHAQIAVFGIFSPLLRTREQGET